MTRLKQFMSWRSPIHRPVRLVFSPRVKNISVFWAAAALLYAIVTYVQREIIWASVVSLAGSIVLLVKHPMAAPTILNPALFEYWIAVMVWCMLPLASQWLSSITAARKIRYTQKDGRTRKASVATRILFGYIIVALCAPVLATLPPLAQGNLLHTRFLPPLSMGRCITIRPASPLTKLTGFAEEAVQDANLFLIQRTVYFFGTSGSEGHQPDNLPVPNSPTSISSVIFLLGTDSVGRDIYSRMVYGSRYSIGIGFFVVFISVLIGSFIGMAAGFRGGMIDSIFMRIIDVLMSIPTLFLVLTLMAIFGQSVIAMIVVLSATEWMSIGRIVRGEVLHLRDREFITASKLLGTSSFNILRIHVFPNVRPVIINMAVLQLGNIFLAEASLSFLGLGIQAPNPSWGNMIADSMGHLNEAVSAGLYPGIALSVLIVAVHLISDAKQY